MLAPRLTAWLHPLGHRGIGPDVAPVAAILPILGPEREMFGNFSLRSPSQLFQAKQTAAQAPGAPGTRRAALARSPARNLPSQCHPPSLFGHWTQQTSLEVDECVLQSRQSHLKLTRIFAGEENNLLAIHQ